MNSDKVKILHIIKSLGRGGAEMLLPETLKLHNKDRFQFQYIYFLPWKNQMVDALKRNGGEVVCMRANTNLQLILKAREVAKYVRENNIQLIHAHLPWAGILARIVGKITGIPVLYTEHNKQERYHIGTRLGNLFTMNWLTALIAVSADVEGSVRKHKKQITIPLYTILNGVNVNHFTPGAEGREAIRRELKIPLHAPVIGTVAVFRFQKRLDVWLQMARKIRERIPEAHFVIVGDGPLKEQLLAKANELGLEGTVHFTGLQTEIRPYLTAFDLYMMSSVFEGLPIAMLEAMASGCAVITTDAGGIKEVIRHERNGLMCHVDDPDKLVEFAMELIKDPAKRKKIGMEGRKRIEERFSLEMMVCELEKLYLKVLAPAP